MTGTTVLQVVDVTEARETAENFVEVDRELRARNADLRSDAQLTEFAYVASHDLSERCG